MLAALAVVAAAMAPGAAGAPFVEPPTHRPVAVTAPTIGGLKRGPQPPRWTDEQVARMRRRALLQQMLVVEGGGGGGGSSSMARQLPVCELDLRATVVDLSASTSNFSQVFTLTNNQEVGNRSTHVVFAWSSRWARHPTAAGWPAARPGPLASGFPLRQLHQPGAGGQRHRAVAGHCPWGAGALRCGLRCSEGCLQQPALSIMLQAAFCVQVRLVDTFTNDGIPGGKCCHTCAVHV